MDETKDDHQLASNTDDSAPKHEAKLPFGKNIVFAHNLLGQVEVKYISVKDARTIRGLLKETNFRYFAVSVVHNQLIQPRLALGETESWPDDVLIEICLKLLENEPTIKSHFQRRAKYSFFEDFHQAFAEHEKEQLERLAVIAKGIQSQVGAALERVTSSINTPGFKAAMQALAGYDFNHLSATMQAIQNMSLFAIPPGISRAVRPSWLDAPLIEQTKYQIPRFVDDARKETIGVLLSSLEPELERKRKGAWQTFRGESQDKLSQAMSSMREVLRQLLDLLAPENDILRTPWYSKPLKGSTAVTRKMRIRFALARTDLNVSQSTLELIDSLAETVDKAYYKLSAETHRQSEAINTQVEAYLKSSEAVILLLLANRNV